MIREDLGRSLVLARHSVECINILDTGSATTLAGRDDADDWVRQGFARRYSDPLPSAIRHIRGIGALNRVQYWLEFTLDIGGVYVTFTDVPVLDGHRGLLLGNDFLGPGRARLEYDTDVSGALVLRGDDNEPLSLPVRFRTNPGDDGLSFVAQQPRRRRRRRGSKRAKAAGIAAAFQADLSESESEAELETAADFGSISAAERLERAQQQRDAAEVESELEGVMPVAWAPETVVVPAWSEVFFRVRVPETLARARDVLLTPLEDERRQDLGVLVAPTLQRVDNKGYVMCRAVNMSKKSVRIPLLTPVARFQIDPRVYNIDYEFTVDEIVERVNVADDLNAEELAGVRAMLAKRRALFRSKLGYAHGYKMKLRVPSVESGENKPPNATLRLRSTAEEEALVKEVKKQWAAGLIEPCTSKYRALPMLIKKPTKEGEPQSFRTVLDYRGVNALLEPDVYPLPNLETNLSALGKANWYSSLDLLQGFHQVELEDDGSKAITSFATPIGQFQYVRMPMGLASSPSTFMRLVDATLRGLPPGIALAYIDDVVVPTCGSFEDHMRDVGKVFDRLIEGGFAVRCDKCHIGMKEVPYLGFYVGRYGTRPMPSKTKAILDMAMADMHGNPAAAARYSGMLGFYNKFLPDLHVILAPFHELKAKATVPEDIIGGRGIVPSLRFLSSFTSTKHLLAAMTAIVRPDNKKVFYIHVDAASSCGIGAVLMQRADEEDAESLVPLAFWSRRLRDEEKGYSVRDQECLGLHEALKTWRHFVLGNKTVVMSDHSSLQWLLSTPHPDGSTVAGWALYAQQFNLNIQWIPGPSNVVADCLSRSATSTEEAKESGASGEKILPILERLEDASLAIGVPIVTGVAIVEGIVVVDNGVEIQLPMHATNAAVGAVSHAQWSGTYQQSDVDRQASRVAVVLLQPTNGGTRVFLERADTLASADTTRFEVPSALVQHNSRLTYRAQAARMLLLAHGERVARVLKHASSFRRKAVSGAETHFFAAVVPQGIELDETQGAFQHINDATLCSLPFRDDSVFLQLAVRQLGIEAPGVGTGGRIHHWNGSFARLGRQLATCTTLTGVNICAVLAAEWRATTPSLVPSIDDAPNGPALCESDEHGERAIELIFNRLRAHPGQCLSLDLEGMLGGRRGHIDLMQLAVDRTSATEEPLVFVFNTHLNRSFLSSPRLRSLLEDPTIPKIMHCSYGDASALYCEYDICVRGGFDTGVADCLLRDIGFNRQRKLDVVMAAYLPDRTFTYKQSFEHVPRMFQHARGALPPRLFVYAYEDVVHCGELYLAMRAALEERGLLELCNSYSAIRAPPLSLPCHNERWQAPAKITVVVRDEHQMICIKRHSDGLCALSTAPFDKGSRDYRMQALTTWARTMGHPPKPLSGFFSSRLRKATWLANTLLMEVVVTDCSALLSPLRSTAELLGALGKDTIVLRPCCNPENPSVGACSAQVTVFQQIHWACCQANVPVGLSNIAEANVVVGKVNGPLRAAVIVHDSKHVYTLTTDKGPLQFPSAPIEIGSEPLEAAVKAFDVLAGPALRKRDAGRVGLATMPESARRIRAGFDKAREVAQVGNTIYFACHVPDLAELESAFFAARAASSGYRVTVTMAKRHPGFHLCKHDFARVHLDLADASGLSELYPSTQSAAAAQHSGTTSQVPDGEEEALSDPMWHEYLVSQQESRSDTPTAEEELLFDAAVAVHYAEFLGCSLTASDANASGTRSGAMGTPPSVTMPTIGEVREAQELHPATRGWVDYLRTGELSAAWAEACTEAARQVLRDLPDHYFIDDDGLLCRRAEGKAAAGRGLLCIPPSLRSRILYHYHDRQAHFGVDKVLKMLQQRFYWGGTDIMRNTVAEYIKSCHPCQLSKMPTHQTGEQQIGFCGHHPGDVVCGDVFYVGFEEDGYDHTLDFACCFSRGIRSDAMKGMPCSEEIVDCMLNGIIREGGVPSEVRSDAGSNFISKAVQFLYKRMGITIEVGTAFRHQLVALVERWHRTLLTLLRVHRTALKEAKWSSKWYRCLPLMELAYNITVNNSTGYSPFFIRHLRHARAPADLQRTRLADLPKDLAAWVQGRLDDLNVVYDASSESLRVNALTAKRKYDLRRDVTLWFQPGDRVLLIKGTVFDKSAVHVKAVVPMDGPFTVTRALPHDRYELADLGTRRIRSSIHVSRLVPYFGRVEESDPRWKLTVHETGGSWPVQGIVGRRLSTLVKPISDLGLEKGEQLLEYRVRWTGFGRNSDTWRPLQSLGEIMELVNEYDQRNPRPAAMDEHLERVPRPDSAVPPASAEAMKRRHYRSHPHPGEARPPLESSHNSVPDAPVPELMRTDAPLGEHSIQPAAELQQQLAASMARFPVGARVRTKYRDQTSWDGTVVKSWLPRWRTVGKVPAHHITVSYDDPAFEGELFEHNVQESVIEVLPPVSGEGSCKNRSTDDGVDTTQLDDKKRKRLLRIQRQLA